jgi:hypothetical protein
METKETQLLISPNKQKYSQQQVLKMAKQIKLCVQSASREDKERGTSVSESLPLLTSWREKTENK